MPFKEFQSFRGFRWFHSLSSEFHGGFQRYCRAFHKDLR